MRYTNTHGRLVLVIMMIAIMTASCRITRDVAGSMTGSQRADEMQEIIFLNYMIRKQGGQGKFRAEFTGKIISVGRLKEPFPASVPPSEGDLEILILDHESRVLRRFFHTNPLNRTLEYVAGEGHLAKKEVQMDSAAFALRFQLTPYTRSVVLNQVAGAGKENEHLITTEI